MSIDQLIKVERDIIEMLANGLSPKEIAGVLATSTTTVSRHLDSIRKKLGAKTKAHAVALYIRGAS